MTEAVDQPPDLDPLTREAIAWVVRLTSGEATAGDAADLKRWRAQSPAHEDAFRRAAKLWKDFGTAAASLAEEQPVRSARIAPVLGRRAFIGGGLTALAASAAYAVVSPPLDLWPSLREFRADYRTAKGEQRHIDISPDVSIELSTLTSLAVRSMAERPRLELIAGEAAITANAVAAGQLIVVAADGEMTAACASFNARCIDGLVCVTCLSGEVEVRQRDQVAALNAGQQISYTSSAFNEVISVDAQETTSWRTGMLVFRNRPLAEVIEEVNRYRPGRIVIANAVLGKRVVNGTFRRDQLGGFIAQVEQLFGAKVTALPAGLTVLS